LATTRNHILTQKPFGKYSKFGKAYTMMQALEPNQWTPVKAAAVKEIIAACAGLSRLEAVAQNQEATRYYSKIKTWKP
jgi:hypothetical protein